MYRYQENIPQRVRVLILGGGIHGVGIAHDLASRGWKDVFCIEKDTLGFGTSSRSTKLIHGGLRYLKHISQFGLVADSLRERKILIDVAPDLVKPLELLLPVLKGAGTGSLAIKVGLSLYDFLSRKSSVGTHRKIPLDELGKYAPNIDMSQIKSCFSYWDAQTDDLALVNRVADAASELGAGFAEGCEALEISKYEDGFKVKVKDSKGQVHEISALYVVNALGPWANKFLQKSNLEPTHQGVNNKGCHLILPDLGIKKGLFLESPEDRRIFFVLPWLGKTLIGTTEGLYQENLDKVASTEEEIDYMLDRYNRYFTEKVKKKDIEQEFAGLRWLAVESGSSLTSTSRELVVGEIEGPRGLMLTLYGGKLTGYRSVSQMLGDKITSHFGEFKPTATDKLESWKTSRKYKAPELQNRW